LPSQVFAATYGGRVDAAPSSRLVAYDVRTIGTMNDVVRNTGLDAQTERFLIVSY